MSRRRNRGWRRWVLGAALAVSCTAWAGPPGSARIEVGFGSEAYAIPGRIDAFFRPFSPALQGGGAVVLGAQRARAVFGGMVTGWVHPKYRSGMILGATAGCEGWVSDRVALEGRMVIGVLLDGWSGEAWLPTGSNPEWTEGRRPSPQYLVVMPGIAVHWKVAGRSGLFLRYETGPMVPVYGFPAFLTVGYAWRSS